MPHLFCHIMVRADQDVPNWILDESGRFTLKSARTFFLEPEVPCGWGIYLVFIYPTFQNSCPLESFSWAVSYRPSYSK